MEWLAQNKDAFEAASYVATVLGIAVAAVAAFSALKQIQAQSALNRAQEEQNKLQWREGRWAQARDLYVNVLKLAMDNPEFSNDFWQKSSSTELDRIKYRSFMALFLLSIEDILELDDRPEWIGALAGDLAPHAGYLAHKEFEDERKCYFEPVQRLLDQVAPLPSKASVANA